MTRLITITGIIISILALSLGGINYAKETKTQMDKLTDIALVQCQNQDFQGLVESAKKMSAFFESRHGFLSFFVRHDEIEKIDTDLVSLLAYTKIDSLENVYLCLDHIRYTVDHIYNRELPNMDNLF